MVSMTFFTFSLMMPSHYEGSGEFPEILGKGRTMVEQGISVLAERATRGRETKKVGNAVHLWRHPEFGSKSAL
jgi:hypothetical protein